MINDSADAILVFDADGDGISGENGLEVFGDNTDLPDTLIFAGENEIFCKDIKRYVENLKNDGVNVKLVIGNGLFHIYPLFPMPEAYSAFKEIKNEIMD